MGYMKWVISALDGRLGYLQCECLGDDFRKNPASQRVHLDTVKQHVQFAQNCAGTLCKWLGASSRAEGCEQIQRKFQLSIQGMRDRILLPLRETAPTATEAGSHIDAAYTATEAVRKEFLALRELVRKNLRNTTGPLADEDNAC